MNLTAALHEKGKHFFQNAADAAGDAAEALARGAGRTAGNANNAATDAFDLEGEEF